MLSDKLLRVMFLVIVAAALVAGGLILANRASASPALQGGGADTIRFNGVLTDPVTGSPLNGFFDITFRIYNVEIAGASLWEETHTGERVNRGVFNVALGSVLAFPDDLFVGGALFLEIQVAPDPPMEPRQVLARVPAAFFADKAGDVECGNPGCVGRGDLEDRSVGRGQVDDKAIGRGQVDDKAIGRGQVDDKAIGRGQVDDKAIGRGQLDDKAVGRDQIGDLAIGTLQLADGSVTSAKIQDFDPLVPGTGIQTVDLANGAVTTEKISSQGAGSGQVLTFDGTDILWETPPSAAGDISAVFAGAGLAGGGTSGDVTLSVDTSYQLPQVCAGGQVAKWNGTAWECAVDLDTDTQLTDPEVDGFVTNGALSLAAGTTLNGASISTGAHTTDTLDSLSLSCASGQVAKWNGTAWECAVDLDTDTTLDQAGVVALGFATGPHTVDTDTTLDQAGVVALGFVTGPHAIDTTLDQAGIVGLGFVTGPHATDTTLSEPEVEGFVTDSALDLFAGTTLGGASISTGPHTDNTKVANSGDTMTGTLNFSNVTNDITTGLDEDLALMPGGSGDVGIGTTNPGAFLSATPTLQLDGDSPAVVLNETDGGNARFAIYANSDKLIFRDLNASIRMVVADSGNVGIGTKFPSSLLHVQGLSDAASVVAFMPGTDTAAAGTPNLNVGIGTTTPGSFLSTTPTLQLDGDSPAVVFNETDGGNARFAIYVNDDDLIFRDLNASIRMVLTDLGELGIGTTGPTAQLHTTGTVRFGGIGAGTLQTDASGNVTASSDIRLKNIQGNFDRGLSAILNIDPISYKWKQESGLDTDHTYTGFSAQNVQHVIPEAVNKDSKGQLTLSDRPIIAALVNAVKELSAENAELTARLEEVEQAVGLDAAGAQTGVLSIGGTPIWPIVGGLGLLFVTPALVLRYRRNKRDQG